MKKSINIMEKLYNEHCENMEETRTAIASLIASAELVLDVDNSDRNRVTLYGDLDDLNDLVEETGIVPVEAFQLLKKGIEWNTEYSRFEFVGELAEIMRDDS